MAGCVCDAGMGAVRGEGGGKESQLGPEAGS